MKPIDRIIRWGGLAAVIGLVCAMSPTAKQGGKTKPFKETGYEYFVTGVIPGSFQHPFYQAMREEWGRAEDWAGFLLQTSQNNIGGQGSGVATECVYWDEDGTMYVYVMKYEVVASGDQLAMAGMFSPQPEGLLVRDFQFISAECTGRFAGATGSITDLRAIPGPGYVLEGTIATVGAAK